MKTTTKKKTPAVRSYDEDHYTCDRCGKPCGEDEETRSSYDTLNVQIEMKSGQKIDLTVGEPGAQVAFTNIKGVSIVREDGSIYPGSANIEVTVIDCCATCFEKHVLPALKSLGFTPRTEDRGW